MAWNTEKHVLSLHGYVCKEREWSRRQRALLSPPKCLGALVTVGRRKPFSAVRTEPARCALAAVFMVHLLLTPPWGNCIFIVNRDKRTGSSSIRPFRQKVPHTVQGTISILQFMFIKPAWRAFVDFTVSLACLSPVLAMSWGEEGSRKFWPNFNCSIEVNSFC